ncbi:hypothetical protein GCM10023185_46140 [Hymenobacter saemangeumensis]|uniref:Phosphopantetheine adenylyltransferase n=1 Tax=Hymenobacter saemangeumensis TaxID=1084522 RepID=A0ABP8ISS8_9BACT
MELIYRISLFIAGVINLLPSFLAFLPARISSAYGIAVPDANHELLLRHRAVLFGIVGGMIIYSALSKQYYMVSTIAGLVSMLSFILLYLLIGNGIGPELRKVMIADSAATVLLLLGTAAYLLGSRKAG